MNHTEGEINTVWRSDMKVGREFGRNEAAFFFPSEKFSSWSEQRTIQFKPVKAEQQSARTETWETVQRNHLRCVTTALVHRGKSI